MKKSILLATLPLALAMPLPAQRLDAALAQSRFQPLDADRDGKLSAEDAKPIAELLRGAEADGDGFFPLREVLAHL